ncbi:MAG: serine/threonine protein kinase [Myxococcaceae bacterium]|nr:serine/threonine protein kinase [Myxococcaceae bacterium]
MPGLVFDKYEVLERLAAGGMGEVLLARQVGGVEGFERLVILKTLLPELASDPSFINQFVDEARVVATLSHPNVVSVFEVGVWDGTYYLAMEYIPGPNLAQLRSAAAKAGRVMPLVLCAQIGADAAVGLDHAHSAKDLRGGRLGVVHRDISPQNIMVRVDGVTKVVDFGIARAANRASRTETGMVKGKLGYMPPEQLTGKELDGRADQYSLGITLWELCCGRPLFAHEQTKDIFRAMLTRKIPRPSELLPDFPPALEDVLMRMLDREPDRRYPRCQDVAQALNAFLKESREPHDHAAIAAFIEEVHAFEPRKVTEPVPNFVVAFKGAALAPTTPSPQRWVSPPSTDVQTAPEPPPGPPRRWAGVAAITFGVLAVLGAAAFWSWPAPSPEPVVVVKVSPTPEPVKVVAPEPEAPPEPPVAVVAPPPTAPAPAPHKVRSTRLVAPPPDVAPSGVGHLTVRTKPYTVVSVDGDIIGSTPLLRPLPAGKHFVLLVNKEKGISETREVTVAAGEIVKLDLEFDR